MERGFQPRKRLIDAVMAVPVRLKIAGITLLPVLMLGLLLTYWIRTGLSDWLSYLLTDERVQIAMDSGSRSVLLVTILAAALAIALTYLLMLLLTKPLLELRQVAHRVAAGDLTSRAQNWTSDEVGDVAVAVNGMIDSLVSSQRELTRTNRRLEALNRVVMAASQELDVDHVLHAALETTLDIMGLDVGWILLREGETSDDAQFYLAAQMGVDGGMAQLFDRRTEELCACQLELLSGELASEAAIKSCLRLSSMSNLTGNGNKKAEHITIPLDVGPQRFGVINMLCPTGRELSSDDTDMLTAIGVHLSVIVSNAQLHASLIEKEAIRQALLKALVSAQENERARLARELHDGAGQTLTSLLVRLKVLEKKCPSLELQENMSQACEAVSETIADIRELSYRLRPTILEEFGLESALRSLVVEMADAANIEAVCNLHLEGRRLSFEFESGLYRIAQECLTNIVRHARARRIVVELLGLPHAVALRIEDDGIGFDREHMGADGSHPRLGLVGIQERAEMLGGSMVVRSAIGSGTSIQVRIPYDMMEPV